MSQYGYLAAWVISGQVVLQLILWEGNTHFIFASIITKQKHYTDSTTTYHSYRESTTRYNTYEYTEGSLTIDIRSPQTDRLLWQGVGMGTIDNNPKGQKERANKNIAKIFKGFPISKSE